MLRNILSPETCAKCRICCIFDKYDVWETPVVDCKIWPYRIMELNGVRVISVASICPDMYAKPLNKLVGELENGLADKIFAEADKDPAMIKPYEQGYPILKVELQGRKEM